MQRNARALLVGFGLADLAFLQRAANEEPGREVQKPRREPHALGGVEDVGGGREALCLGAARALEVGGRALDQRHALLEDEIELF